MTQGGRGRADTGSSRERPLTKGTLAVKLQPEGAKETQVLVPKPRGILVVEIRLKEAEEGQI